MLDLRAVDRNFVSELSDTLSGSRAYASNSEAPAIELTTINFSDELTCTTTV